MQPVRLCLSCLMLVLLASLSHAAVGLPYDFDKPADWEPKPTFLGNPTDRYEVQNADGVCTLRVNETGKGMKFLLPLKAADSGAATYLLVRYRARNIGGGGYAIWAFDDSRGGREIVNPKSLVPDGQWHVLALDLEALGVVGDLQSLVFEVQCRQAPAEVGLDYLRPSDTVPAGATALPSARGAAEEHLLKLTEGPLPQAEPDWLALDAPRFGREVQESALHLWAEGRDRGMKFSLKLPQPLDLNKFRFAAIRYRATGLAGWGDYAIWLGSGGGGQPSHYMNVIGLNTLRADGEWHVAIATLSDQFLATDMAFQVCAATGRGDLWIDSLRFTTNRPYLALEDTLPLTAGWGGSKLAAGQFVAVDLGDQSNARAQDQLSGYGLKSWLPGGKFSARGIPFATPAEGPNVIASKPGETGNTAITVNGQAREAFVLLATRLPRMDACRMGDPVPMEAVNTPERLVFAVHYADGVTDRIFPVAVSSGRAEVARGCDVYALPHLRPVALKRLVLENHMDSARFLIGGVTLNNGKPLATDPAVAPLPPSPGPAATVKSRPATIRPLPQGYLLDTGTLTLSLKTAGGITVLGITDDYLRGAKLALAPGPLFTLGVGEKTVTSTGVTVGKTVLTRQGKAQTLTVPVDAAPAGVPLRGELVLTVGQGEDLLMRLNVNYVGDKPGTPQIVFPTLNSLRTGAAEHTWYLWAQKGGLISNQATTKRQHYGGEYPLQVADVFNPAAGAGLALLTYDLQDVYRLNTLTKDDQGVSLGIEYWQYEHQPGERVETVPTALRAHAGDWRAALRIYRQWTQTWYKPQVPRKAWFQKVFYYQQCLAWSQLRDPRTGQWRMGEVVKQFRDTFGCLDYLHIFDFGQSPTYGRVGDYNHYDELGGLAAMRGAIKQAQDMGVKIGLYIEGYLCDTRGVWGREHVAANCLIQKDGKPLMWPGSTTETMMCAAAQPWRDHLAETYKRVAGELQPNGMYIDQYGFVNTWKTCWSREHGHPVPWAPIRGEHDTTRAIRGNIPTEIANLTEETPNDVNSQCQDGALGYSVVSTDPRLAPHRVDLFRFQFPSFKVLQLVNYNRFTEGGWYLLKWPFFNGEAWWLSGMPEDYCDEAKDFLRQAFAILHRYEAAFTSSDVEPLVPTLKPTVYANRFTSPQATVWTLYNADTRTFRGDLLTVPHKPGTRYVDAFTGKVLKARVKGGLATLPVELGPCAVGCVVAER